MRKFFLGLVVLLASSFALAGPKSESKTKVVLNQDNSVTMNTYFDSDTVAKVVKKTRELDSRLPQKDPIYLILSSGGGSIEAGLELIDNLKNLNRPVTTISLFAASMGFQTVQGLGERFITEMGTLMSHKARGMFGGEFPGQIDSRYGFWLKRVALMNKKAVERTNGKHTVASYDKLIENEYWCQGRECLAQGFADRVVDARCDESLQGTQKDSEKFYFLGMAIEVVFTLDKCPLNTGLLGVDIFVDGENLYPDINAPKNDKKDKKDSYSYFDYSYTPKKVTLTKEQYEQLEQRVQELKDERTNKVVKKSY